MRYILSILKSLFYKLAFLFVLLASLFVFLIATTPGLYLTMKLIKLVVPGELHTGKLQGRLIDNFSIGELSYQDNKIDISLKDLTIQWQPKALLKRQLVIKNFQGKIIDFLMKNERNSKEDSAFNFPKLPFSIAIQNASADKVKLTTNGSISQFRKLNLQAKIDNQLWQITNLDFNFLDTDFALHAQAKPFLPYALSGKLDFNLPKKNMKGFAEFGGDFSLYHWHVETNNPANLLANGTLRYGNELHFMGIWHDLVYPLDKNRVFASSKGKFSIDGKLPVLLINLTSLTTSPLQANVQVNAETGKQNLSINGLIELAEGKLNLDLNYNELATPIIEGKITAKSLDSETSQFPIKNFKFDSYFQGNSLEELTVNSKMTTIYFGNLLQGSIDYQNEILNAVLNLGKNKLELKGSLPYHWQLKANLREPGLLHPTLTELQTVITASASLDSPDSGSAMLTIQPGNFQLTNKEPLTALQFAGGQLHAKLNPQKLEVKGGLKVDGQKSISLLLSLPQFQLDKGFQDSQKIEGNLSLKVNSLNFLSSFSNAITKIDGQLNAVLKATGTLKKPLVEGQINLDKARLLMTQLGIDLNPIQINLQSRDKQWQTQGSISSQGQKLFLTGIGTLAPQKTGTITIDAVNFPLLKTDEYLINLSPKLVLNFKPGSLVLTGTVLVPNAQIKPQSFTSSVSLSGDAVFVGNEPVSPPNPFNINSDIRLEMGSNVELNVKGLKGFLDGAIRLRQLPQGPLNASGELTVRDGTYQAYGQDLAIDQGELIFTGGLIDNPGINVRASRRFKNTGSAATRANQSFNFNSANLQAVNYGENTSVGILVTGRLKSPRIELFSEPSTLSQADILSMLILGIPISQVKNANQGNSVAGQLLLKAVSSMNLGTGTRGAQLMEQLKQNLGLDINIQTNSKYNQQTNQVSDSNSVVVGKSLSKRIYLSYNFGLAQTDSNVLTLTYLLNKFFSIQVNASATASGIDLLYTHYKDKKNAPLSSTAAPKKTAP